MTEKRELSQLIKHVQKGDLEAFGIVYDRFFDAVYAYVYRQVGSAADAEDITSGVFLEVLEKIDGFSWRGGGFTAWLFRIARNDVTDFFRRNGGRRREIAFTEEVERMPSGKQIEHLAEQAWDERHLREAVGRLPAEQQQVVLLKLMLNLSNRQVGDILDKSEGAIKALQHRATKTLKKLMDSEKVNDVCKV